MPDYQKMYATLLHATEQAIEILVFAQRKCEDMYIREPETDAASAQESTTEEA